MTFRAFPTLNNLQPGLFYCTMPSATGVVNSRYGLTTTLLSPAELQPPYETMAVIVLNSKDKSYVLALLCSLVHLHSPQSSFPLRTSLGCRASLSVSPPLDPGRPFPGSPPGRPVCVCVCVCVHVHVRVTATASDYYYEVAVPMPTRILPRASAMCVMIDTV